MSFFTCFLVSNFLHASPPCRHIKTTCIVELEMSSPPMLLQIVATFTMGVNTGFRLLKRPIVILESFINALTSYSCILLYLWFCCHKLSFRFANASQFIFNIRSIFKEEAVANSKIRKNVTGSMSWEVQVKHHFSLT